MSHYSENNGKMEIPPLTTERLCEMIAESGKTDEEYAKWLGVTPDMLARMKAGNAREISAKKKLL